MRSLTVLWWEDQIHDGVAVRIQDTERYLQTLIPRNHLEPAEDPKEVILAYLESLCHDWYKRYGQHFTAIRSDVEGELTFQVVSGDVIDGEVIEERKAIESA